MDSKLIPCGLCPEVVQYNYMNDIYGIYMF